MQSHAHASLAVITADLTTPSAQMAAKRFPLCMAAPFRSGARGGKRGGGVERGLPRGFRKRGVTGRKASPRNGGGFP